MSAARDGRGIASPVTGAWLGEREVSLTDKSGAPPGTILGWNVLETEGVVHSDHQRPGGKASLVRFHP